MKIPNANLVVTITLQVFENYDVAVKLESPTLETQAKYVMSAISALAGLVMEYTGNTEQQVLDDLKGFRKNKNLSRTDRPS